MRSDYRLSTFDTIEKYESKSSLSRDGKVSETETIPRNFEGVIYYAKEEIPCHWFCGARARWKSNSEQLAKSRL